MSNLLEIKALCKNFGGVQAINQFNLELEEGSIVGLIGPNGAGKTTIFNTITGIYNPSKGQIFFDGKDITGCMPYEAAQWGISRTFQNIRLFSNLSVMENVVMAGNKNVKYGLVDAFLHTSKYRREEKNLKEMAMNLLELVSMQEHADAIAGSLPYGHQRRLEIARALATNPKLLLLDEPAAGMNAEESIELVEFIRQIKEKFSLTVLMIEHHMDVVSSLCERAAVLNFGEKIAEGSIEEIKKDKVVVEAYLGKEG